MDKVVEEISKIEKRVAKDDKDVEDLVINVQKKAQRFKEFDLKNKLTKRQKQCEEGKVLKTKVKNRATKYVRKVLEKSDQRLSDQNKKFVETLKVKSQKYKAQYEDLAKKHEELEINLEKNIAPKIPKDTLSISIHEQIRLIKELK